MANYLYEKLLDIPFMTTWHWKTFGELTTQELYDIMHLRQEVFALEQNCLYQDLDYRDQAAMHLFGVKNNKMVAYLRLFPKGILFPDAISFGRVLTVSSERNKGLAKEAMNQVINFLNRQFNDDPIIISAQLYLKEFYSKYGLKPVGEAYNEDGIPHIEMKGHLKA